MRRRNRWLLLLALVPLLPVAAVGAALAVLDPDDYKGELTAAVQRSTGRVLSLGGPLRVAWALSPTVEVSDVTLANLPGGTRPDMARAERIEARLSLWALLHRRLEVEQLTLIGPNILFELVDGRPNWVLGPDVPGADPAAATPAATVPSPAPEKPGSIPGPATSATPGAAPGTTTGVPPGATTGTPSGPSGAVPVASPRASTAAAPPPPPASPASPVALAIERARVRNGMVTLRLPNRTHVVGIRSLDWQHLREGAPLDLRSVLVYSDYEAFSFEASATPTGEVHDPWNTQWRVTAFDATLEASGQMSLAGRYDLQVEGDVPALEKLNALLPPMGLPALRGVRVSSHLRSGRDTGDLPVIGKTALRITGGDLGAQVPGLVLGPATLRLPEAGGVAEASGSLRYAAQPFGFEGRFGVPARLEERNSSPVALMLKAEGGGTGGAAPAGTLQLDGTLATEDGGFRGLEADTALQTPSLPPWARILPKGTALPPLTALSAQARLSLPEGAGTLRLRDAKLSAREAVLAGEVTLTSGTVPAVQARLRGDRLDLDALLGDALSGGTTSSREAAGGTVIPDTPLHWEALRGNRIDLQAKVGATRLWAQDWRGLDLAMRLADSQLQVERLGLQLPGGPATLSLSADARSAAVPVSLTLDAPAVPLSLIGRYAGLPGGFEGAMRLQARLRARGRSLHAIGATLDGTVAASVTGGGMSNAALMAVAAPALKALGITVPAQGRTEIRCLDLTGTFDGGVGRFPLIALNSTHLQLDGAGEVDLGAERLSLGLRPLVPLAGAQVSAPVVVEGPFRAIEGKLDASGLDKVGLLLGALFGGDQAPSCAEMRSRVR
ncbi:AsmA family protein [Roseomonas elaeocarpi]|uniref:AsmA family protein n=1 Tax=Roseomonas elaeocarpi TaxID=907779 RepID=A0ABV6JWD6_9PROT